MNERPFPSLMQGPPLPPPSYYSTLPLQKKEPYVYTTAERLLAVAALLMGFWGQFMMFDSYDFFSGFPIKNSQIGFFLSFFPYFVAFVLLNRHKLKSNKILCSAIAFTFLLTFTDLLDPCGQYRSWTYLLMPCLLLALGCYARGDYEPKKVLDFMFQTLLGLFYEWFSAVHRLLMSLFSLHKGNKGRWKTVLLGLTLGVGMLVVLLPLMATADSVFSYFLFDFLNRFFSDMFPFRLFCGGFIAFVSYSLLWNSRFKPYRVMVKERPKLPFQPTIVGVSFGVVLAVYLLFCGVQFTYLFAGAALPQGMSYSEYAVSGFWELVQIACINLALFGFLIEYGPKSKGFLALKLGLLTATGVMLASAILRLNLYIQAYDGMTWLRLVSMWFLIYMAGLLALCVVRLFAEKFPVVAVAALGLLAWWVALGFAMPWVYACWPNF